MGSCFVEFVYLSKICSRPGDGLHKSCIAVKLRHSSLPTSGQIQRCVNCCLSDLSFDIKNIIRVSFCAIRHGGWWQSSQALKRVAITHSAGGASQITIIPNTLDKGLGFQSSRLIQTRSNVPFTLWKLHFCVNMGVTYFTLIKCCFLVTVHLSHFST